VTNCEQSTIWDHVILQFYNWSFNETAIMDRRSKGITEEKQIESANLQLIRFNMKKKVPAVFLDLEVADNSSKSATDIDSLKAFKRESNKLWKFILEQPSLKIKTMTDVLEDLQALTAKTNQLEVEKSALKEELSLVHSKLVETETKIKRNENRINKSHKSIAKNNQAIRKNQQLRLNDQKDFRIRMEHINIKQQVLMGWVSEQVDRNLPVGTILAWSGQNISKQEIPKGWQMCDGSPISTGPMAGSKTPNLWIY